VEKKKGKYGKYKNKICASALKRVVYLLEYRTRISPLKSSYKNGGDCLTVAHKVQHIL